MLTLLVFILSFASGFMKFKSMFFASILQRLLVTLSIFTLRRKIFAELIGARSSTIKIVFLGD